MPHKKSFRVNPNYARRLYRKWLEEVTGIPSTLRTPRGTSKAFRNALKQAKKTGRSPIEFL